MQRFLPILFTVCFFLLSTAIAGQSSSLKSNSISPVVSFAFNAISETYTSPVEVGTNTLIIEVEENFNAGFGFLYQLKNERGRYLRLGINRFTIGKAEHLNTFTTDFQIAEPTGVDVRNSIQIYSYFEYGMTIAPSKPSKFKMAIGGNASPFLDITTTKPITSVAFPYSITYTGISFGLSPNLAYEFNKSIALTLTPMMNLARIRSTTIKQENPFVPADQQNNSVLDLDATFEGSGLMLGLNFTL